MKFNARNSLGAAWMALGLCAAVTGFSAVALEPQTLFNFQQTPYPTTSPLVQGPMEISTAPLPMGGATWSGQVLRVMPVGALTIVASDLTNLASGLVVGNDGQLYGSTAATTTDPAVELTRIISIASGRLNRMGLSANSWNTTGHHSSNEHEQKI